MKVYLQWATSVPSDAERVESAAWRSLPKKPEPDGTEVLDEEPGWLNAVVVQGVEFTGMDHIAIDNLPGGAIKLYTWSDDLEDGVRPRGEVWEFRPGRVDRTARFANGQAIRHQGPDQRMTVYSDDEEPMRECGGFAVKVLPWSAFPKPPEAITRHGVWVPDELFGDLANSRSLRGWEEWE